MTRRLTRSSAAVLAAIVAIGISPACSSSSDPAPTSVAPRPAAMSTSTSVAPVPTSAPTSEAPPCQVGRDMTTVVYRELDGIDPNLTSLDVHPVAGICSAPVVMWVHGGGYRIGDKRQQVEDKVRLFNDLGWTFVSVNYRLTTPGRPGSAQYPDHFEDVAASVAWVHDNIADRGGDPERIALLGHSAGADIVSNVVTNPVYLAGFGRQLSDLRCAGPLDTEGFDKAASAVDDPDGETEQWRTALGNLTDYRAATSATLLVRPGIGIPPMIGAVRGSPERQRIATDFLAALRSAGVDATSIDARSLTHRDVTSLIGAPGDEVMTPPLVEFLTTCFR